MRCIAVSLSHLYCLHPHCSHLLLSSVGIVVIFFLVYHLLVGLIVACTKCEDMDSKRKRETKEVLKISPDKCLFSLTEAVLSEDTSM